MAGPSLAVLSYPTVHPANMASLRRACAAADVPLAEILPHDLWLRLDDHAVTVYAGDRPLAADVVMHRTVFPYRQLVFPLLYALAGRCVVLNDPHASALSRNKLHTALVLRRRGLPILPSDALSGIPPAGWQPPGDSRVVAKPAMGAGGRGIVRLDAAEAGRRLRGRAGEGPLGDDVEVTIVQPYVDADHDLRAFVVDGECVALGARLAAPGEWRCNVALGATVGPVGSRALEQVAASLAVRAVAALGLDFAAVDLLHDPASDELHLSEVDAWGGFVGLEEGLGADVAGRIVQLACERWMERTAT